MCAGRRAAAAMPADSAARLVQRVFCHVMAPLPLRLVKSTFACEGMSGCAEKIGRLGRLVVVHECIVVVVKPSSDGGVYCQVVAGLNSFCMLTVLLSKLLLLAAAAAAGLLLVAAAS